MQPKAKKNALLYPLLFLERRGREGERNMGVRDPTNGSVGFKSRSSEGREEICVCVSLASKACGC
jgi:hypothetical protein